MSVDDQSHNEKNTGEPLASGMCVCMCVCMCVYVCVCVCVCVYVCVCVCVYCVCMCVCVSNFIIDMTFLARICIEFL